MADGLTPDGLAKLERAMAEEHVSEVLFDPQTSYEADCLLCKAAVRLGLFEAMGYSEADLAPQATDAEEELAEQYDQPLTDEQRARFEAAAERGLAHNREKATADGIVRAMCMAHLEEEPCSTCAAYIAGGL